jgi:hypothetical protein
VSGTHVTRWSTVFGGFVHEWEHTPDISVISPTEPPPWDEIFLAPENEDADAPMSAEAWNDAQGAPDARSLTDPYHS